MAFFSESDWSRFFLSSQLTCMFTLKCRPIHQCMKTHHLGFHFHHNLNALVHQGRHDLLLFKRDSLKGCEYFIFQQLPCSLFLQTTSLVIVLHVEILLHAKFGISADGVWIEICVGRLYTVQKAFERDEMVLFNSDLAVQTVSSWWWWDFPSQPFPRKMFIWTFCSSSSSTTPCRAMTGSFNSVSIASAISSWWIVCWLRRGFSPSSQNKSAESFVGVVSLMVEESDRDRVGSTKRSEGRMRSSCHHR